MNMICKCEFKDCPNSQQCKRFLESTGEIMNFKAICKEENQYKWICKTDSYVDINKNNIIEGEK